MWCVTLWLVVIPLPLSLSWDTWTAPKLHSEILYDHFWDKMLEWERRTLVSQNNIRMKATKIVFIKKTCYQRKVLGLLETIKYEDGE